MACAFRRSAPLVLSACSLAIATCASVRAAEEPPHSAALDEAIIKSAARHGVPESLIRRVVMRESRYNAHARNHSFWGLMQISYPTAKSMGFHGTPQELLNPVTNLRYAVPYLANAFVIAGKHQDAAIRLYAHGYYEAAKRRGLLDAMRTADSTPLSGVPDEPEVAVAAPPPPPQEDGGIFGALFGPQQMQRDPQTEQVVYASAAPVAAPAQAAPQPAATPLPDGKSDDGVAMTPDRHGDLRPPKSWQRDGGTTVIARGEQSAEQVAAAAKTADAADAHGRGRRHGHKSTLFAALDAPPANAQAYAADASGDPRLMQTESQAAIAQATGGQATGGQATSEQAAPGQPAAGQAPTEPQQTASAQSPTLQPPTAAEDAPAKKGHRRHLAHRSRHRGEDAPAPAVASAESQALPQGAGSSQQASDAAGGQAQQPAPTEAMQAPQPAPVDASAQPAAAATAAPQQASTQQASAQDAADDTSSHRHKHRSRHARAHKSTAIAAQAPGDGEPQPSEYQPK